ncbi:transposase [Mycobacterium sp. URHB0021]
MDSTIARAHQHATNITRGTRAGSNYTNLASAPPDHGIGRSRGGLTSKIHHLVDGRGRPLVVLVGAGQAHDGPVLEHLLAHLKVDHYRGGRPRTRPARIRGDKAYSSRATRTAAAARDCRGHSRTLRPDRPPQAPRRSRRPAPGPQRRGLQRTQRR